MSTKLVYAENKRAVKLQGAVSSMSAKKLAAYRAKFRKRQALNSVTSSTGIKKKRVSKRKKAKSAVSPLVKISVIKSVEPLVYSSNCIKWSALQVNRKAQPFQNSILKYSKMYGVDSNLVKSVITAESCFKTKALSHKGAQGLMQLIPATAKRFGVTDSYMPDQNIRAGTKYLKFLLKRFDGDLEKSIAGYNAGEGAVDKYAGVPPYKETKKYVKNVLKIYGVLAKKDEFIIATRKKYKVAKLAQRRKMKGEHNNRSAYKSHLTSGRRGVNPYQPAHPLYRKYALNNKRLGRKPGRQGWQQNRQLAPQLFKL